MFNVTLEKFDATSKPKIIKEIKNLIPNMNLMEVRHTNPNNLFAQRSALSFSYCVISLHAGEEVGPYHICPVAVHQLVDDGPDGLADSHRVQDLC